MQIATLLQKYIIISVGWLLICIVLLIAKTDTVQDGAAYSSSSKGKGKGATAYT